MWCDKEVWGLVKRLVELVSLRYTYSYIHIYLDISRLCRLINHFVYDRRRCRWIIGDNVAAFFEWWRRHSQLTRFLPRSHSLWRWRRPTWVFCPSSDIVHLHMGLGLGCWLLAVGCWLAMTCHSGLLQGPTQLGSAGYKELKLQISFLVEIVKISILNRLSIKW